MNETKLREYLELYSTAPVPELEMETEKTTMPARHSRARVLLPTGLAMAATAAALIVGITLHNSGSPTGKPGASPAGDVAPFPLTIVEPTSATYTTTTLRVDNASGAPAKTTTHAETFTRLTGAAYQVATGAITDVYAYRLDGIYLVRQLGSDGSIVCSFGNGTLVYPNPLHADESWPISHTCAAGGAVQYAVTTHGTAHVHGIGAVTVDGRGIQTVQIDSSETTTIATSPEQTSQIEDTTYLDTTRGLVLENDRTMVIKNATYESHTLLSSLTPIASPAPSPTPPVNVCTNPARNLHFALAVRGTPNPSDPTFVADQQGLFDPAQFRDPSFYPPGYHWKIDTAFQPTDVVSVTQTLDQNNQPAIAIHFGPAGAARWSADTTAAANAPRATPANLIAIFDGKTIITAPQVISPSSTDTEISGALANPSITQVIRDICG